MSFISTKRKLKDYVQKLETTLSKLKVNVLKCKIEKAFFQQTKMEY